MDWIVYANKPEKYPVVFFYCVGRNSVYNNIRWVNKGNVAINMKLAQYKKLSKEDQVQFISNKNLRSKSS